MLLKVKEDLKKWYTFYAEAIRNRLRIDKNLADVSDVQKARDNLGLSGDNNHTHNHDDRYMILIQKEAEERKLLAINLQSKINSIIEAYKAADAALEQRLTNLFTNSLNSAVSNLKDLINKMNNTLTSKITDASKNNGYAIYDTTGLSAADIKSKNMNDSISFKREQDENGIWGIAAYIGNTRVSMFNAEGGSAKKYFADGFISLSNKLNGVAEKSGIICAGGSDKPNNLEIRVNDVLVGFVTRRRYGTGTISATVPVNAGDKYSITGRVNWAYIRYYK